MRKFVDEKLKQKRKEKLFYVFDQILITSNVWLTDKR